MISVSLNITETLKQVLGESGEFTPLHVPSMYGNEITYLTECVDTGWISSVGRFVTDFEVRLAEFCSVKRAVAVNNGTAALQMALIISGVERGDEVLMPSLTFVATANAVSYIGGCPHFVDVEETTLGIDPIKLQRHLEKVVVLKGATAYNRNTGRRISALVPMHTFGHPVRIDELKTISEYYSIPIVEDAAESLGSYYKGKHTGSFGVAAAVSFNGNKIISTGGGGAVLTNNDILADKVKHLTTTAKIPHQWKYDHDHIGYNFRMPNINAALGVAQLERLTELLGAKRELAEKYKLAFAGIKGVRFFSEPKYCRSNYWLCALLLDSGSDLESTLELTNESGIMTRPAWTPLHQLKIYRNSVSSELSVTNNLSKRIINIPSSAGLA